MLYVGVYLMLTHRVLVSTSYTVYLILTCCITLSTTSDRTAHAQSLILPISDSLQLHSLHVIQRSSVYVMY